MPIGHPRPVKGPPLRYAAAVIVSVAAQTATIDNMIGIWEQRIEFEEQTFSKF